MDWVTGIQRALDYIEAHLDGEIRIAEASRCAACSEFYFQRIFGILCGISLGDYIRARRLTLAGSELRTSDAKVIDVALKYGYESPESFTRAFSRFHGITPSEAKKDGAALRSFSRLSVKITLSGGSIMDYRIIEKEAFDIIERTERHSMDSKENAVSIPAFWTRARADGTLSRLSALAADDRLLGICYASSNGEETMEYSIAAACGADTAVPEGFHLRTIPARTWAVFACRGAMPDAIQQLWHRICGEFFPASGYRPTCELDIEVYFPGDMSSPDYRSEIWIPVTAE